MKNKNFYSEKELLNLKISVGKKLSNIKKS